MFPYEKKNLRAAIYFTVTIEASLKQESWAAEEVAFCGAAFHNTQEHNGTIQVKWPWVNKKPETTQPEDNRLLDDGHLPQAGGDFDLVWWNSEQPSEVLGEGVYSILSNMRDAQSFWVGIKAL